MNDACQSGHRRTAKWPQRDYLDVSDRLNNIHGTNQTGMPRIFEVDAQLHAVTLRSPAAASRRSSL